MEAKGVTPIPAPTNIICLKSLTSSAALPYGPSTRNEKELPSCASFSHSRTLKGATDVLFFFFFLLSFLPFLFLGGGGRDGPKKSKKATREEEIKKMLLYTCLGFYLQRRNKLYKSILTIIKTSIVKVDIQNTEISTFQF